MISADLQSLEPGHIVTLLEVDLTPMYGDIYRFHSHMQSEAITWQGNVYEPWPFEANGFEMSSGGNATPRMRISNIDGLVTSMCILYDDIIGARVNRHRTFAKYLDGMPDADPNEHFPLEIWIVEQKLTETNEFVDFELSSALNFDGVQLPRRLVLSSSCSWIYRSSECSYTGPPVADQYDNPTSDPTLDVCGKRLQSCKLRFGDNEPLPFGGFPSAGII